MYTSEIEILQSLTDPISCNTITTLGTCGDPTDTCQPHGLTSNPCRGDSLRMLQIIRNGGRRARKLHFSNVLRSGYSVVFQGMFACCLTLLLVAGSLQQFPTLLPLPPSGKLKPQLWSICTYQSCAFSNVTNPCQENALFMGDWERKAKSGLRTLNGVEATKHTTSLVEGLLEQIFWIKGRKH